MSLNNIKFILLKSLSSIFAKAQSTNNYKILDTIAHELENLENQILEAKKASLISTAAGSDLDKHGKTYDVQRDFGESDEDYRQKLINSYDKGNITWNNLKNLVQNYNLGTIDDLEGYQHFYDRWWLGGKHIPPRVIENVSTITGTIVRASSGCYERTIPECWLQTDVAKTGTNYASGSTFANDASGALITLTTPLSADTPVTLVYTPNVEISGNYTYDQLPFSFLNHDTIVRHRSLVNNFELSEESENSIIVNTNMLPNYPVYITYYDENVGTVYNWETTVDNNKQITINETKRTDNLIIDEYSLPDEVNKIKTEYQIGNLQEIRLANVVNKTGKNYAINSTFDGKTITLADSLPFRTGVITTYNRYKINDYTDLNFNNFFNAGFEDFRFTIEFDIYQAFNKYGTFKYGEKTWGELTNPSSTIVSKLVDIAKAAGIKSDIIIMVNEVKYGNKYSIYGNVFYGGSYW